MNTRYPGEVLKTVYFAGRSGSGRIYVPNINVDLEPLEWYYLVLRNNHPDPANNRMVIYLYVRSCRYFAGVPGNGIVWLYSSDNGTTWSSWMDGVTGIDIRFSDGSSIFHQGFYNFHIGEYPSSGSFGTMYRDGVYIMPFAEGRMNVSTVTMAFTYSGVPPAYRVDVRDANHPYTLYASSRVFYKRRNDGAFQPIQFSSPVELPPARRLRLWVVPADDGGDSSNRIRLRGSPLRDSTFEHHNKPFNREFRTCSSSNGGLSWVNRETHIPGCIFLLHEDQPFLPQSTPTVEADVPEFIPQPDNRLNHALNSGASARNISLNGSVPMRMIPINFPQEVNIDEFELWVESVSNSPTATVSLRLVQLSGIPGDPLVSCTFSPTGSGWYSLPLTGVTLARSESYYLAFEIQPSGGTITLRSRYAEGESMFGGTPYSWDGTTLSRTVSTMYSIILMVRSGSQWLGGCTRGGVTITYPKVAYSWQMPGKISLFGAGFGVSPSTSRAIRVSLYRSENWIPVELLESVDVPVYDWRGVAEVLFSQAYHVDNFSIVVEPLYLTTVGVTAIYQAYRSGQPVVDRMSRTIPYARVLYHDGNSWNIHTYNTAHTVPSVQLFYSAWPLYQSSGSAAGGAVPGVVRIG